MKQDEIKIDGVYRTRINGKICDVRITARREEAGNPKPWPYRGNRKRTVFDWVRLNPPPDATKLRGSDVAASLHPARHVQAPEPEPSPGGEPVPERGDRPTIDPVGTLQRVRRYEVSTLPDPDSRPTPIPTGDEDDRCRCLTPLPGPENGLPSGYCGRCGKAAV